jgi:putative ABC transport system permease protein
MLRLSLRLLARDWRAGELHVLMLALLVAVTCVTSVAFFTDRINRALQQQAGELLGGDLRLVADHPLPPAWRSLAQQRQLDSVETRSFRSMVIAGDEVRLAEIKAVGKGYPLRGHLRIAPAPFAADAPAQGLPKPGEVWVEPLMLQQLGVAVGDRIKVGEASFRISAVLTFEPDRSGDLFNIAPRLLMNLKDLAKTGLEQEGSRIRYSLLVAGDKNKVAAYRRAVEKNLKRGERVEGVSDARQEVRIALERAHQFLGLAAVVSLVLACVAIVMTARRFAQRRLDACAIMRCLGAQQAQINQIYLLQIVLLGVLGGVLGTCLGLGLAVGLGSLLGFALPPILQLHQVPTLRVLRRELGGLRPVTATTYLGGLLALAAMIIWQAGELRMGLVMLGGVMATALVLWLSAWLLIHLLKRLPARGQVAWRFGLANLTRRPAASITQVMAFGVGIMVLLLLTLIRSDLLEAWAGRVPVDAPNRFVINIQPPQLAEVKAFFNEHGLPQTDFFPMVRGRLTAINGKPIDVEHLDNERAKRLATREFNLSWTARLQGDNKIVAGKWWGEKGAGHHWFSVEEGIAKTLGLKLGDRLRYDIAGQTFEGEVTNLRSVQWDSFRANFFVVTPPGVLDIYPASYMTSFYVPAVQAAKLDALVQRFPNLTIIDVSAILNQVRNIIERVTLAVEYVFLFTLAAGLVVLYAAIHATFDERLRENAILRALGAQRRRLWSGLAAEFVTLGSVAGLLAAALSSVLGLVLARQVLDLNYVGNPWVWVLGLLVGGVGVGLAGTLGTRQVIKSPPLAVLRKV